ncbi:bifunctional demethylmenaquinone methyltransferase/2-methoxy-6-polyprenyl-1,4-benzoquinol methylase UbiE [Zavarzinia sp. CC-PAN008]|uniref:bifunctional demethylmenaquinone methyltransferase/2-methoxy-6-polyprenyl-1,4-benzoquinol methylase UbiE n=1 Tax=Zavarzinia sp. CC-PAN008 TaxID=3243332 RepID=UPI003F748CCD
MSDTEATDFGFQQVPVQEKAGRVRQVFDRVASRYDLMNDLMSGGVHRLWKARLVDWLNPRAGQTILDLAGGTGDVAFAIQARGGPGTEMIVLDINAEMIAVGRDRALNRGLFDGLTWVVGDAETLPLPDKSVDAVTIAFGIRNVTRRAKALADIHRVLKRGGRFLCLEFSQVEVPVLERLYTRYSFEVIPRIGQLVAGDAESYRYLVESIAKFPAAPAFAAEIEAAGFAQVRHRALSGGIAALHSGWRL